MGKSRRKVSGFYPKAQILLVQVVKFKVPASKHSTLPTRSTSLKLRIRIRRCLEWNLMQKPHDGAQKRERLRVRFPPIVRPFSQCSPFAFLNPLPLPSGYQSAQELPLFIFPLYAKILLPLLCLPTRLLKYFYCISSNMHIFL